MEGENKMVKKKQEVVHKARRQLKVITITFNCLLFLIKNLYDIEIILISYFSLPEKILMRCSSESLQIRSVPSSSATI